MVLLAAGLAMIAATRANETGQAQNADHPRQPPPHSLEHAFPLEFDSEEIHLIVEPDSLTGQPGRTLVVDGTYRLVCHAATGVMSLMYPFPADPRMGQARPVRLEIRAPGGDWVPVEHALLPNASGLRCRVPLLSVDTLEFHAVYRQELIESYARYIVTTTRAWGKPLRRARFTVCLPAGMELAEASYPFAADTTAPAPRYAFLTEDFWPERDIVVEWRPAARPPGR